MSSSPHDHALTLSPLGKRPALDAQHIEVRSGHLIAQHGYGVLMPRVCVACGSSEPSGDYVRRRLDWSPKWTYITLLVSPLLFLVCYFASRKSLQAEYYLCPSCLERERRVRRGTTAGWGAMAASLLVALASGSGEVVMISALLIFFVMIVLALVGRSPLRIASFKQGRFLLQTRATAYVDRIRGEVLRPSIAPFPPAPHAALASEAWPSALAPTGRRAQSAWQTPAAAPPRRPVDGTDGEI